MDTIYLLSHLRDEEDSSDEKIIGVYASEGDAQDAVARLRSQPGFRRYPDGFVIDRYEIGKDHWTEGFGPSEL